MERRLLEYYNRELRHLRDMGREFAREHPKVAGRLDLEGFECADPYVERLLEGFAFLAARVQLKIDAEFPAFTEHLLECVYPDYLAQTPSMAVVKMEPEMSENLMDGVTVPRHTVLRSGLARSEQTRSEYRTAHEIQLWPLAITEAQYLASPSAVVNLGAPASANLKAGLRLRLRLTAAGQGFNKLALDRLPIFLPGEGAIPEQIYEQLLANAYAVAVLPVNREKGRYGVINHQPVRRVGFEDEQALLPWGPRSFHGYRLLREYFAFPKRFRFVELAGLRPVLGGVPEGEVDLVILLDRVQPKLINAVETEQFELFCTPAINLFPKRADRIHITHTESEYHILPDRTRPADFEVYAVEEVTGYGARQSEEYLFRPFYSVESGYRHRAGHAYYTLRRHRSLLSSRQRQHGPRTPYQGTETYISLVDAGEAPYRGDLKQLGFKLLCTNRDLPHSRRARPTEFSLESGLPVHSIHCVAGPTDPKPSAAVASTAWNLISHLSLNYLSLLDSDHGAAALRELLGLYGDPHDDGVRKQIEGLLSAQSRNVVRRIDAAGPIVFGRGVEITVNFEETAFEGGGAFLLGAVLEQFFARYASLNTFTETVITTAERGEIKRWPIRTGCRHRL